MPVVTTHSLRRVTNAQFPECITALEPVTQLYVSIDAATPSSLRAIDRPLFADFWERFLGEAPACARQLALARRPRSILTCHVSPAP